MWRSFVQAHVPVTQVTFLCPGSCYHHPCDVHLFKLKLPSSMWRSFVQAHVTIIHVTLICPGSCYHHPCDVYWPGSCYHHPCNVHLSRLMLPSHMWRSFVQAHFHVKHVTFICPGSWYRHTCDVRLFKFMLPSHLLSMFNRLNVPDVTRKHEPICGQPKLNTCDRYNLTSAHCSS